MEKTENKIKIPFPVCKAGNGSLDPCHYQKQETQNTGIDAVYHGITALSNSLSPVSRMKGGFSFEKGCDLCPVLI